MSDEQNDPSGNTAAFQAFVRGGAAGEPELIGGRGRGSSRGIVLAVAAVAIIVVGLLALAFAG